MARAPRPQSAASAGLAATIRRMREQGFPVREIARRTGISKSQVHNISIGKRRASEGRAVAAASRLGEFPVMRAIAGGELVDAEPLTQRDRAKLGRYLHAVGEAKRTGDFREVKKSLPRSGLVIKTTAGRLRLETDSDVLKALSDGGELDIAEIYPVATAQAAA
jgi:transcriptional regulator with XRE-family HTH domain